MKIKDGFKLRTVMGNSVIVAEGPAQKNFNKIISLNPSAAMLWQQFEGRVFTAADMASALIKEYGIDADTAGQDAQELADAWFRAGLVDE